MLRGVALASHTRLTTRLKDSESDLGSDKALDLAQRMSQKLSDLDSEFLTHHRAVIDLIDEGDEALAKEQVLDAHDDLVTELSVRVKRVTSASSLSTNEASRKIATRKLSHLQKLLNSIASAIGDSAPPSDMCLLKQYEERMSDLNKDLARVRDDLLRMELEERDELFGLQDKLEDQVFDCSVKLNKLLSPACTRSEASTLLSEHNGVRYVFAVVYS